MKSIHIVLAACFVLLTTAVAAATTTTAVAATASPAVANSAAAATVTTVATPSDTAVFKVYGNCSSCKKHIETAARAAGVAKADWNKDTKMLTLVYDPAKVNTDDIQKRIAAVGYDTPKYKGDDKAYNKLDECCQYDRKQP